MRRTSRSLTPPTSSSLAFDSPARGNSNTAAFLRMGAHPKLSQILQMYPELESLLKTPSLQKPAVNVSLSPRSGAAGPWARRASITPSEATFGNETPMLHCFFPVSYEKSTSSEEQFKQKQREPLPMVRDDEAAEEDQDVSIIDDDIIRITASEGIPVQKVKALEFSQQALCFLLSKDFMKQFFWQFTEAASEFQHDPMSSFSQIFLPRKGAAEKFDDAQQSLVPVLWEKETKQDEVQPQKQVDPGKDEAAAKLQTQQSIPESDKTQASGAPEFLATDWTDIRKYALKGETLLMGSRGMAMPMTYDAQDANPRYDLTPLDLQSLVSMILTDSQFIIWEAKWRKALNELRVKYQGGANAGFTIAQLAGDPPLDSPAHQAGVFPRGVLTDIKNAARKAMVQIPPAGVTESSFTDIKQGPSESFTSFVNRLTQAVDRQVTDEGVKSHLIRCLAFANANPECKRVISAMPGQPSMAEILEACSKAFASLGVPQEIKTDNGPTCIGKVLDKFLKRWGVHHTFGIPHSPTEPTPPMIRHFSNSTRVKLKENPLVLVRNPETGQIEGPFKLITWGKGYACVSTAVGPKWLAAGHVKPYRVQTQAEADPKTGGREVGTQT
ncbi:hypothetical protein DUI87_15413 [Hirundo rustica rustica]|uniref:Uncharacterized protein n=1 Tax=Hirundo rustica rustica TaxID=333673 RepID=A0A3M0K448_HIRRU|nr:hypothetical protein DUI87_15413 [Hirundo rustica rustica]